MSRIEKIGLATLYLGDCLEILPTLPLAGVSAIIADPPYGISFVHGGDSPNLKRYANPTKFGRGMGAEVHGDEAPFDPLPILALGLPTVLWGANHYASRLPDSPAWIVWDKSGESYAGKLSFADVECAWTNAKKPARIFYHLWRGCARGFGEEQSTPRVHPMQKPAALMRFCMDFIGGDGGILDPFMGSGTTGVAAVKSQREFTGIEISEKYFDIACKRIEQAQRQGNLFAAEVAS